MSPGRDWLAADRKKGRKSIFRALKIDPSDQGASYATLPFRLMHDHDNAVCIGGAVGIWRCFNPSGWTPDDVSDVILWNPVAGTVSLCGSTGPELVLPDNPEPRLTVYGDGFAFFRAWADRRAETFSAYAHAKAHRHVAMVEPRDSGIPGALAIGDLAKLPWRETFASVLVAGPGIDARHLNRAVIRSAHLPRVESLAA